MFHLNFPSGSFDIILSEGAIYQIGFEKGLKEWTHLLTRSGYMVASHVAWIKPNPPQELKTYWEQAYPEITTIGANLETAKKLDYQVRGYFVLPAQSWRKNYYNLIEPKLDPLIAKYRDDSESLAYLASEKLEQDMLRRYFDYYSYVFYVLRASF